MSYQVLARKWRPQRFDDVIGQQAVTRTLRNAIESGRLAHAYVFAGTRGSGKTTTARILARALNCLNGPTPDPCGECDACVEIAAGRDMDVIEIDAATNTQVEKVREVIISTLALSPARDRYKIFIIDEVHRLSQQAFDALLKSIEEPPSHVIFMMATTELRKVPDTILSRAQLFEFRDIPARAIGAQLRRIAGAEGFTIDDAALAVIARAAEGSMRDAQSALDQVVAFCGTTITVVDVAGVLGLVGRDLLFDILDAIVAEDAPAAFRLAERALESGANLKHVFRDLSQLVRDLMLLSIDPSRADDPEIAPESERERLVGLAKQFSREDLLRSFDLLNQAEIDMRDAAQPRYHLEMALLKWMHLRKLVPLGELVDQLTSGGGRSGGPAVPPRPLQASVPPRPAPPARSGSSFAHRASPTASSDATNPGRSAAAGATRAGADTAASSAPRTAETPAQMKDALLAEIRSGKAFFYNTVVAQARRIEATPDQVLFTFLPNQKTLREQFEEARAWLEAAAERVAGRRITVRSAVAAAEAEPSGDASDSPPAAPKADLKAEAMSNSVVQGLLEVFPAEIKDIEEM